MTRCIGEVLTDAIDLGVDRLDAEVLLYTALNKSRTFLIAFPETELTDTQDTQFTSWLQRRLKGEPIAYILGVREFWSLAIKTSPATLIPRPDTEVLVETVLAHCPEHSLTLVDLGTGTGAIALALKSERRLWHILGIDKIPAAVVLAKENAHELKLDVEFKQSSWCEAISDDSLDVIVSNPPYIDEQDHHLTEGDVRFEPSSALVSPEQGLADIKVIAGDAIRCLHSGGKLFLEHGWKQAQAVQNILIEAGFVNVQSVKDYAGNDRVTFGARA